MTTCLVALDKLTYTLDKEYEYLLPDNFNSCVAINCRVIVPFGVYNTFRQGIILSIEERSACYVREHRLKTINSIVDNEPIITDEMLDIAYFIKSRCFCTLYDVVKAMLPPHTEKNILNERKQEVFFVVEYEKTVKLTEKQCKVYKFIEKNPKKNIKDICKAVGVTSSVIKTLQKKGVISSQYMQKDGTSSSLQQNYTAYTGDICLSKEQTIAYNGILNQYNKNCGSVMLLYGVTGSGKTSVFLKVVDKVLQEKKDVILMVPEIALTSKLVAVLKARYSSTVAVFHSGLSRAERKHEYLRVLKGEAHLAVGTRSAVFAPLKNIGLIIMDEEHDGSYKSASTPRFHARNVAKFRCIKYNALLLLASATPSIESYYMTQTGKYSIATLSERYGEAQLPNVRIIDMNDELIKGNVSLFSDELIERINENLKKREQTILLLNRRGHNTFVSCRSCGEVISCPNCSISMTYHSFNNRMICHYCGYSQEYVQKCPKCGEQFLRYSGVGTQKIEYDLQKYFPDAKILRMDADATTEKHFRDRELKNFENGTYDIMVGTQMISKGLDFSNVTLVGVISADQSLYCDDFRSYEKSFDLITQVVGRSGRSNKNGVAVIQTFTPENPIIELAAQQNYLQFYRTEIDVRKHMLYPPFVDICMIIFSSKSDVKSKICAEDFLLVLKKISQKKYRNQPIIALSPRPANVCKVQNKYRYRLIVKCKNNKIFREMISKVLEIISKMKSHNGVSVVVDMNPEAII